jgi:DNA-binding transcriptional LysR family regulator
MEIKQLEVFACVAKTLNFSKAVSAQISALEKSLGAQLLVRNTKGVSLTKAGLDFLVYARKILSLREQAINSLNGENRSVKGAIDIISSTVPAQHLLPEIIASFQKQWPNIVFRLEQADSHRVELEMSSFRYDFGMVGTVPDDNRFNHHAIFDDELVLVVPTDGSEDCKSIRDNFAEYILSVPFIMRESGSGTRKEIETLFNKIGVDVDSLHIPAYFSDAHSILLAVSKGMGVSLISKVAASMYVEAGLLRAVEMDSVLFRRRIFLLYNKEIWLSPVGQAFVEHACRYYRGE